MLLNRATCCWCNAPIVKVAGHFWCGNVEQNVCRARQRKHAQYRTDSRGNEQEMVYLPLPRQTMWHEAIYNPEIVYFLIGGAAGPGKSTCIRRIKYELAKLVPGWHSLLIRKTHKDLDKSHLRFMPHEVQMLGGEWKAGDRIAVFKTKGQPDSIIRAGHFEDSTAIEDYLSAEFDCIAPDEVVTLEEQTTLELFTRSRSTNETLFKLRGLPHPDPEEELDGSFILAGSNPGGRLWVKDHWITKAPDAEEYPNYEPHRWAFFDAKLRDNPYIKAGYVKKIRNLRETRRRQLEDGDWDVFEGMFFSEWQQQRQGQPHHVGRFEELYAA